MCKLHVEITNLIQFVADNVEKINDSYPIDTVLDVLDVLNNVIKESGKVMKYKVVEGVLVGLRSRSCVSCGKSFVVQAPASLCHDDFPLYWAQMCEACESVYLKRESSSGDQDAKR